MRRNRPQEVTSQTPGARSAVRRFLTLQKRRPADRAPERTALPASAAGIRPACAGSLRLASGVTSRSDGATDAHRGTPDLSGPMVRYADYSLGVQVGRAGSVENLYGLGSRPLR